MRPQKASMNDLMDGMVIRWLAQTAKESVPRGDQAAAESAFCSEVCANEYAHYFPWLETTGGTE